MGTPTFRRRRYPVTPILPVVNYGALTLDESYLRKLKRDGLQHLYLLNEVQGATVLQDERGLIQLIDCGVSVPSSRRSRSSGEMRCRSTGIRTVWVQKKSGRDWGQQVRLARRATMPTSSLALIGTVVLATEPSVGEEAQGRACVD